MRRTLPAIAVLVGLVTAVGAQAPPIADTQTKVTTQLVDDIINSSNAALVERNAGSVASSALWQLAGDRELVDLMIAQRRLSADVARAEALLDAAPAAGGGGVQEYYQALSVAVATYQSSVSQAHTARAQRWNDVYSQAQQDLATATTRDIQDASTAVQNAQVALNNSVHTVPPAPVTPGLPPSLPGGAGVGVLGEGETRTRAEVTSLTSGRQRPIVLETLGVAEAPNGMTFVYGQRVDAPNAAAETLETWGDYGEPTWVAPAGSVRDEDGATYIIGYVTAPLRNRSGNLVKIDIPKHGVREGDRVWLYDYAEAETGWTTYSYSGGAWTTGGAAAVAGGGAAAAAGGGTLPPVVEPPSTADVYVRPESSASTGDRFGQTPPLLAPAPGAIVPEIAVLPAHGERTAPAIDPVASVNIKPVTGQFGVPEGLSGQDALSATRAIADARTLFLTDLARYATACDVELDAAARLGDSPAAAGAALDKAVRTFRVLATDRYSEYDADVHRAIRSARLADLR